VFHPYKLLTHRAGVCSSSEIARASNGSDMPMKKVGHSRTVNRMAAEYRQYKATFHARPPASASQHLTSAPPAPLGFLSPSQGPASDACCTMAVDTPAQRTYTGAAPS
jgi:hypothetical protein